MKQMKLKNLTLFVLTLILSAPFFVRAEVSSCLALYNTTKRITLLEDIEKELKEKSGGFPLLIVSDVMERHLLDISERYDGLLEKIEQREELNSIQYLTSLTETTLKSFYELNKDLSIELAKAQQNEQKIASLSQKMKTCVGNLRGCDVDIRTALEESRAKNVETQELISALNEKIGEFETVIDSLNTSRKFPDDITQMLTILLKDQAALLGSSYMKIISQHLETQNQAINLGVAQIPAILQTKIAAAHLEASSSIPLGIMSLSRQREGLGKATAVKKSRSVMSNEDFHNKVNSSELTQVGAKVLADLESGALNGESVYLYLFEKAAIRNIFSLKDVVEIVKFFLDRNTHLVLPTTTTLGIVNLVSLKENYFSFALYKSGEHTGKQIDFSSFMMLYFLVPKMNERDFKSFLSFIIENADSRIQELELEIKSVSSAKPGLFAKRSDKMEYRKKFEILSKKLVSAQATKNEAEKNKELRLDLLLSKARNLPEPYISLKNRHGTEEASFWIDVAPLD